MAKIVKTLTVSWQWSGDKYSLRGFNLAVTPAAKNPKEEVVATAFVETKEIKQTYSYKMGNVTLDKDAQYKIWVQAVYENSDSDWVATGGATVSDDGSATIITKTDREIQDIVNMASDNILTRQEKISLRREWQEIVYEFLEIESTAISQGIPSSNTAFSNFKSKGNALGTYLNGGTEWTISSNNKTSFPLWINDSNLGNNTSINGNTYRETFRVYYEAKVKILEEINKYKVNNVQVGGVNLLVGTATAKNTNVNTPTGYVTWDPYTTHNKQTLEQLGFKAGDKVTIGFDWSISKNGTNDYVYGNFRVEFRGIKSDGTDNQYLGTIKTPAGTFSSSNTKGRVEATVALDSATIKAHSLRFRIDNSVLNFKVSNLKMERGTKATGWSPALEEMENAYTIILTNEAQVIPTNSNRIPTSNATYFTDIQVYKGTTQRNDYTIGTVNSANGITVSKTSSRVNFAVSTNTALAADGGNFIIPITIDGKTFNKTFSWSCSKQGNTGASGVGISKITEYYAVSSSNTTEPTSWSTTVPAMTATNKYLWNYETITYSNNTTANTSKRVIGVYGDKGNTGATGAAGNGISNIVNYYLATSSSSGVTTSTSGWTTSVQAVSASKKYLWNYEVITYTNGSTSTTTPCIIGAYGDTGATGPAGQNAQHVVVTGEQVFKYANNFSGTPTPANITLTATKINTTATGKWQWLNGSTWTDWSTNASTLNATTLSVSPTSGSLNTGKSIRIRYIVGSVYDEITLVKVSDGTNGTNGTNGADAYTVILTNETHTFPAQNNGNIPTALSTTTQVVAYKGASSVTPTIGNLPSVSGLTLSKSGTTVTVQANTGTSLADSGSFNIPVTVDGKSFTKTFSWSKAKQGNTGATGNAGQDAITIVLSNENHTFPCESNGNIPTALSTTCVVTAYKGGTSVTPAIGAITNPTGMTITKNGATLTIQANTGTSLADSGTVNIPISVDGKTFNKTFTWSKAKKGATGATGAAGAGAKTVDIIASSQVFKSTDGGKTFLPNSIVLTPVLQNVTYNGWQCSTDGGKTWSGLSNSTTGWSVSNGVLTINNNFGLFTSTNTTVAFRVNTNDSNIYDTITLVKLYDVTDIDIGGRNYIRNGKGDKKAGFFKNFNNVTGGYGEVTLTSQKTHSSINIADGFILGCRDYEVDRKVVFSYDIMYTKWDFPSGTNRQEFWVGQRYTKSSTSTDGQWRSVTSHNLPVVGENGCKLNEWYHVSKIITIPKQAEATIGTEAVIKLYNSNPDVSASFTARFKNVKLEYGNMETDWTPAPEDVNSNIDDVKNSLNSFQNTVNTTFKDGVVEQAEAKAIAQHLKTLDAEKADIDKEYSTIYSNANLTGSAKTNLASAKTSFDSAHTSLKSTINTVISDGRVTSSESASVTSTFNTYNTQLGAYKQRVQEALDNISSGKVNKVEVGGRNYLQNSNFANGLDKWTVHDMSNNTGTNKSVSTVKGGSWADPNINTLQIKGTNVTGRYGVQSSNITLVANTTYTISGYCAGHRVGKIQINVRDKQNSDANIHTVEYNPVSGGNSLSKYYKFETTFTTTSNTLFTLNLYAVNLADDGYTWFANIKLEKGNKASDWVPAPEDVAADINTAKNEAINSANNTLTTTIANYYTKEQTNSQINIAKEAINLGVSNTYETKANVETKVSSTLNSAKSYADTKKSEAINSASSDATTKANNALNNAKSYADTKKTEAINAASTDATNKVNSAKNELNTAIGKKANSADVYTKSEVYTKAQTDSAIKVAKDEINLGVSSTYETKTNVETKVNNAVNNIQIGGRNLALGTGKATGDVSSGNSGSPYSATDLFSGITAIKTNTAWSGRHFNLKAIARRGGFKVGDNLILSVYIKSDQNVTLNVSCHRTKGTGNASGSSKIYDNFTVTPKWQQVWFPFVADEGSLNREDARIEVNTATGSNYIHWAGWKLEKGTKPSDWAPAPEDTTTDIATAKSEAINTASSDATSKVNSAKSELNTAINKKANSSDVYVKSEVYTKAQTDSQIKVAKDEINLGISNTYETKASVETKVNNINFGIRNLARPTSGDWASKTGFNGGENQTWYPSKIYLDTLSVGDEITYSFDIEYSGITVNNGASTFRLTLQGAGNSTGWNTALPNQAVNLNIGSGSTRISRTFKLTSEHKKNSYFEFGFRTDYVNGGTIKYRCGMATKGNRVVQWSPAPEDITTSITNAKNDAINTASTDATNKVNSAKSALNTEINKKANSADVYKKTEVYTKNETNSQITAAKDSITQSVSNTYETKNNVTTKLNNLSVSATNLMDNSAPLSASGWSNWSSVSGLSTNMEVSTTDNSTHGKQGKITFSGSVTGNAGRHKSPVQKLTSGKKYSWSIWLRSGSGNLTVDVGQEQNGRKEVSVGTTWTRFTHTFTANDSQYYAFIIRPKNVNSSHSLYFHSVMLVEGDKPVAWQTSPTEVLSDKTSIEQRMNSAEQKITDTAITNTVKKNFYTKEETEKQITSKGYQTESQVQQTVNNLQIKFTESGGYNLLKNGKAAVNTKFWTSNGGGITRDIDTIYKTCFKTSLPSGIKYDGGDNGGAIRLKNNTHYVYEAMIYSRTAIGGNAASPLHYWCNTTAESAGQAQCTVVDYSQAVPKINTWTKCYVHFVTKSSGEVWFTPFVYTGGDLTGDIWVTELSLSESSVQTPYSPHPNEVYDGIIEMDKNGIKVSTSNGGWTDFTSLGMNVYNKSSKLSLGTRNGGLTYHGGGAYLGFTSESIVEAYNTRGVSISTATDGAYISLGHSSATDPFGGFSSTPYLSIAKQDIGDSSSFYRRGVNVHTSLNLNTQNTNRAGTINFGTNNTSKIFESSANNLCMFGNDGVALGYYEGSSNVTKFKITEGSSSSTSYIDSYAHWRFNQWNLTDVGQLEVVSRLKMLGTSSLYFNANATHPSIMWHASGDGKLKIFGDNGVDIGYREGDTNRPIFKITEGEDGAYRLQSFSHWHFNNWNLDYVGIVHAQRFNVAGTAGSYYITKGTGDGADYNTYGCLFYTHNGLAFTANGGAATVIVQGRSGRIMGKSAYYVNSSKCLKSDIRAVTSESEPMPVNLKQGEVVDETLTMEMIGDFIDTIGIRTYITDFEQEGATQRDVDPQQGHVLNLGYIADDLAQHPVFKYIGEKTPDNLYAINSNGLTTVALAGLQAERKERRKLEQRLQKLEAMLLKGEE